MKTPITDAEIEELSADKYSDLDAYMAMSKHARRLERDRAALMEALERLLRDAVPVAADIRGSFNVVEMSHAEWEDLSAATNHAADTLAAARANFPTE
jgi:hypothetical protein